MIRFLDNKVLKKYKGKTAILRIDLNIEKGEEKSSFRVSAVLPTVRLFLKYGVRVVLISHRGRYGGKGRDRAISLRPFAKILSAELGKKIVFVPGFDFRKIKAKIERSENSVFLLENLRFRADEEQNSAKFARKLALLGDFYVNDAFAVSHRKNASVVAITRFLPSYGGPLLKREVDNLERVMKRFKRPLTLIIGGAKVSTKIGVLDYFWRKADRFLLGGGMANAFMVAKGLRIGDSLYDRSAIPKIKKYLKSKNIFLPMDFRMEGNSILDIGDVTARIYTREIKKSKTVIWNGPLGYFEKKRFAQGSEKVAKAIASSKAFSVAGGGETTTLLMRLGLIKKFSFVSTGGGAMLDYLAGKKLPGIEALR